MRRLFCPGCGHTVPAAVGVAVPGAAATHLGDDDGAPVLCSVCQHVGVLVAGPLGVFIREATLQELQAWAKDEKLQAAARRIRALRARRARPENR